MEVMLVQTYLARQVAHPRPSETMCAFFARSRYHGEKGGRREEEEEEEKIISENQLAPGQGGRKIVRSLWVFSHLYTYRDISEQEDNNESGETQNQYKSGRRVNGMESLRCLAAMPVASSSQLASRV